LREALRRTVAERYGRSVKVAWTFHSDDKKIPAKPVPQPSSMNGDGDGWLERM